MMLNKIYPVLCRKIFVKRLYKLFLSAPVFFSFACAIQKKRKEMNVQKTCSIQFFDLMLYLIFKLRFSLYDRLRELFTNPETSFGYVQRICSAKCGIKLKVCRLGILAPKIQHRLPPHIPPLCARAVRKFYKNKKMNKNYFITL